MVYPTIKIIRKNPTVNRSYSEKVKYMKKIKKIHEAQLMRFS